jgi:uncharacterized membrane protein YqgA involved in biofilm formation
MTGTFINVVAVLIGTALGLVLGHRLTESMRETVLHGLGIVVLAMGIQMAFETANFLIVLGAMLIGGLLGEWWRLEDRLNHLGAWLEARFNRGGEGEDGEGAARFIHGFVTASLVYCIGPLAVLGAFQDGLTGDYRLLAIKSMLDGFASLAFASSMGIGVSFAALSVLVYQGGLTLLARQAQAVLTGEMIAELTAVGGLLMVGIAISTLLEIKPIRVGNFLPALLIAPLIVVVLTALGLPVAPQF